MPLSEICQVEGCENKWDFHDPAHLCETHWAIWWFGDDVDIGDDEYLDQVLQGSLGPLQPREDYGDEDVLAQYDLAKKFIDDNVVVHFWDIYSGKDAKCPDATIESFRVVRTNPSHRWSEHKQHVNCPKCLEILKNET